MKRLTVFLILLLIPFLGEPQPGNGQGGGGSNNDPCDKKNPPPWCSRQVPVGGVVGFFSLAGAGGYYAWRKLQKEK